MTTTMTPADRAARAMATKNAKQQAAEEHPDLPLRAFVQVVSGHPLYLGKVGKVREHNDLSTDQLPDLPVEIGVSFSASPTSQKVWFAPHQLQRCAPPTKWE